MLRGYYEFPNQGLAYIENAKWNCNEIFMKFGLDDILLILGMIMLEKNLVFLSEDVQYLTSTINTLTAMTHPFKVSTKISSVIPNDGLAYLTAPGSFIFGLNRSQEYFWKYKLQKIETNIYIFLDERIIYFDESIPEFQEIPDLSFMKEEVKSVYCKLGNEEANFRIIKAANSLEEEFRKQKDVGLIEKANTSDPVLVISSEPQQSMIQRIFLKFKSVLKDSILKKWEKLSILRDNKEELREAIENISEDPKIRDFFLSFQACAGPLNYPEFVCKTCLSQK